MRGLIAYKIMIWTAGGLNNYIMGYINSYFTDPVLDDWRIFKK